MASDKEHLRTCVLFAFQLKKNAAEATEIICSALGEGAVTHKMCKKWFQRFRNGDFDLSVRERPGQTKKFEDNELEQLLEENPTQTFALFGLYETFKSDKKSTEVIFRPNILL